MVGALGVLHMLKFVWGVLAALAACVPAVSVAAEPLNCLIEPDRVADVGSASVGVIEEIRVERGDFVKAGQVLPA